MTNNYDQLDVLAMAELIEQKKTSPSELVEEAIRRAEAINPQLNAIVHRLYEDARTAAQQDWSNTPFKGVPFVLKDLLAAYAGAPLRSGSSFMGDYTPTEDGELVKRYRAAGLIPIVKSNTPEMGLTPYTEPTAFGTTVNPWNIDHSSGGSSGGSAALVAAGVIPAAHGGDGGGSIRIPSSCCGLFGLKPTHGRTPNNIDYESWHGFATEHVLTRTVRDSAAILDATCAPDPANPAAPKPPAESFLSQVDTPTGRLKIAYSAHPMMGGKVSSESQAALEATVKLCRDQGHELVEATPKIDGVAFARAFVIMLCGQTRADIEVMGRLVGKKPSAQQFEPPTWSLGLLGTKYTASMYASAFQTIQATVRGVHRFMSEYDIFLTPTLALPPIKNGALQVQGAELTAMRVLGSINAKNLLYAATSIDDIADQIFAYMPYTPLFNATGQPAMSMPLYWSADNLPIGLQFVGRYADESTLFRIAGQLERAQSWHDRRPQIYAS